ncbi:hypothetical protein PsalN5692_00042 [Piscirickettsia salmonis]|nr:hypothetical protein PsalN5692_00042 [Piscirickettsia salmonis]
MVECADSRHATLCDADSRGFIVVAFCSAILHHWMCKIPTEVATLTILVFYSVLFVLLTLRLIYIDYENQAYCIARGYLMEMCLNLGFCWDESNMLKSSA